MRLFITVRNVLIQIIWLVDSKYRDKFEGIWEMEFTETKSSLVPPISIDVNSILTFSADSFNVQIIAPESYENLNREFVGKYWAHSDTIFLNVIQIIYYQRADTIGFAPSAEIHKLRYNFINPDSIEFSTAYTEIPDGYIGLPLPSFLWDTSEFYLCSRTSGIYTRIEN